MLKIPMRFLLLAGLSALASGCRVVSAGVITVAAAIGIAGYAVYKTGDAAVTGAGKAGEAVVSGSKAVATVLYVNGDLKVEHPYDVRTVWLAASLALRKAGFSDVKGSFDALSGELAAVTREGAGLSIKFRLSAPRVTELRIRVGVRGDLKTADLVNGLIMRELPPLPPAQEVKP